MSIQKIIQQHSLSNIFSKTPELDVNSFDLFLQADVDNAELLENSPLYTKWGYVACKQYQNSTVGSIRKSLQDMYNNLDVLKTSLFQYAVKPMQLNKDECISDNVFYELVQESNGQLYRQGTMDEFASILTVNTEAVL